MTATTASAVYELSPPWYDVCAEYEDNIASPMIRFYGQLMDGPDELDNSYVTDSELATILVQALLARAGRHELVDVVKVIPGEFLGDYFVLIPAPYTLPDLLSDDETRMEFEPK